MGFRWRCLTLLFCGLTLATPAAAGAIHLAWDTVSGASGYKVYYGTTSGQYGQSLDVGDVSAATVGDLVDCTTYYVAVKAYNQNGESAQFSNELTGWARPTISTGVTTAVQGTQLILDIAGANFEVGAAIQVDPALVPRDAEGSPLVIFDSVDVVACDRIRALVTVEPVARGFQPTPLGTLPVGLELENPDGVFNTGSVVLQVEFNPDRADINRDYARTTDRVDGDDLASFARAWASTMGQEGFEFDCDLDGDTDVDGDDLALLASLFGQCRSGSTWSVGACL